MNTNDNDKKPLPKILIQIRLKSSHIFTIYENGYSTHIGQDGSSDSFGFIEDVDEFIKALENEINNCLWNIKFKDEPLCIFAKERYCFVKKSDSEL